MGWHAMGSLPRVVLHNVVSVDGRRDGFTPDLGVFYGLVGRWREDVTLCGADTLLHAPGMADDAPDAPRLGPAADPRTDARPLLAVVDSRARVRCWGALLAAGMWRGALALVSRSTPPDGIARLESRGVPLAVAGGERVDLRAALEMLARDHGARTVRVESGGELNAALLRAGLVHEVSLVIHPCLARSQPPLGVYGPGTGPGEPAIPLRLEETRALEGGAVWVRYVPADA